MAVRDSMEALIQKIRFEIGDLEQPYVFTDQEIQDQLDRRRRDYRYSPLQVNRVINPGGQTVQYNDFWADGGDWEADAEIVDRNYNVLIPETVDGLLGTWTFAPGTITDPSLRISGRRYDVYGTAADLCMTWISRLKLEFSESGTRTLPGGTSVSFSEQKVERIRNLGRLEKEFRRRAWVVTSRFVRTDLAPQGGYSF